MPLPRLHLLPWKQPLLPQAAAWLAGDWDARGRLDLSGTVVVVPTSQTGRRLRETIAGLAAKEGHAVLPPLVLTPERLIAHNLPARGVASSMDALLAWMEVFSTIDPDAFGDVFARTPDLGDSSFRLRLARLFVRLQETLAGNGLRLASVLAQSESALPERARWEQLAELESRFDAALAARALRDENTARIECAGKPNTFPGQRLVLLATPDPVPLAVNVAARCAESMPVEVVVFGPENEDPRELFDDWGRPRTEVWAQRNLHLPDFERQVHVCADPETQTRRAAAFVARHQEPARQAALGLADPELAAPMREALQSQGVASHDPQGRAMRTGALAQLLELLANFERETSFHTVEALARCPDVLAWLHDRCGRGFVVTRFLALLDKLRTLHLPTTLQDARERVRAGLAHPEEKDASALRATAKALAALDELHRQLSAAPFPANVQAALAMIFSGRSLDTGDDRDARIIEAARAWSETLETTAAAIDRFPAAAGDDCWSIALAAFRDVRSFESAPADAVALNGWLELLWEDAPHLVVAGLNDGLVPAAIVGDPFLPEALRQQLDLKTNAGRLACDNYLLQAMTASRSGGGRIDILLGRTNRTGDPLRPSRLLMRCGEEELPRRVRFLFREVTNEQASLPWRRAWTLSPETTVAIARVPVTGFRDYLQCPFRFYLRYGLRMEAIDPHKTELDARDFGTLCHAVLERMGRDPSMRECTDPNLLRDFLHRTLERETRARFGSQLSLPLIVQLESARQRLTWAAEVQARDRAEGWLIERVEERIEFELGGLIVRGTVDRIDRHAATGVVRLLDYKTTDSDRHPRDAHVRRPRRGNKPDTAPPFASFRIGKQELVWQDLQLPLYRHALAAELGRELTFGYFNLPKATSETAITIWDDYDDAWQTAAETCAHGVAEAVVARHFAPPVDLDPRLDPFAGLFQRGAAESITWDAPSS